MAFQRRPRPPRQDTAPTLPCILDGSLTNDDVIFELQQLRFERNEFSNVRMDADVRDHLIGALTRQAARR